MEVLLWSVTKKKCPLPWDNFMVHDVNNPLAFLSMHMSWGCMCIGIAILGLLCMGVLCFGYLR